MVEFEKGQKYFGTCFASRKVAQTFAYKNDKMFYITLNTVWKHGFHSTLACTFERLPCHWLIPHLTCQWCSNSA